MPIPLSVILYDRGASGVPTTSNPENLSGKLDDYQDTIDDRYGFSTARCSWTPSRNEVIEWARADHLLRPMVAYSPDARVAWEGFLAEIEIELGTKKIAFSLKDMANRLTVRYATEGGAQGNSTTYSSTASQALFGIKDRVINASIASSAAAGNQAQTILNVLAFPRSKQPSTAGTGRGGLKISLTFWGWYATLDWLLTSSTSTTTTTTSTQIASLLSSYAGVNNFVSTSSTQIVATGVSDTEYIEPDTSYREKVERLLARGNSSQQPLAWGFYEGRAFKVEARASATPSTITYYESEASGQIRDAYGNVVDPWDVRPNAMAQVIDLIDSALVGAAETPLRKYVSRVQRRISGNDVSVTLEPEDVESLEQLLSSPAGGGPAGTSAHQAAFETKVSAPIRSFVPTMDNPVRYNPTTGVWTPASGGTGVVNTGTISIGSGSISTGGGSISTGGGSISTGGGSISTGGGTVSNTGGGTVDLGTGTGIGGTGSSAALGSGTTGRVAEWASSSTLQAATLIKSGAGVLTLSASGAFTLTVPATGTAALGTGTSGRVTEWSGTNAVQASTLIKSGAGVLTLSAASTQTITISGSSGGTLALGGNTLTLDDSIRFANTTPSSGDVLTYNGTAFAPAAPAAAGAPTNATYITQTTNGTLSNEQALASLSTGVMKSTTTTGVVSTMTGASGRITEWSDGTTIGASTLIKSGAGVLTLSAASTQTITISGSSGGTLALGGNTLTLDDSIRFANTTPSSGDVLTYNGTAFAPAAPSGPTGSGTASQIAYWTGSGTLSSDTDLRFDGTRMAIGTTIDSTYRLRVRGTGTSSATAALTVESSAGDANFYVDDSGGAHVRTTIGALVDVTAGNAVRTASGIGWDLGSFTASGDVASNGYVTISISGTSYRLMTRA